MLNNYLKYYFSITFSSAQKKLSKKRFFLRPLQWWYPLTHFGAPKRMLTVLGEPSKNAAGMADLHYERLQYNRTNVFSS